ncbi:response regulator [Haloferula chungangensis]|uniref:Response regulator n=1 Tax=Haloferula chungangensis TaxID=1048331 RepID=A0ABW2L7S6_9BACT
MSEEPQASVQEKSIKVWVVEDHDLLRRTLLRLCVPSRGLECPHAFGNAEAMLKELKAVDKDELPDLLLTDVGLPGRSGLEVIGDVRELAPDCRILILTVFEDEKKIGAAISAGACGYLLKTARPEEIVAAIHEAAEGGSPMSPAVASRVVQLLAKLTKTAEPVSLSPREKEILSLIVDGLTAKEIAERLGVSIHTTDTHTRHLFKKLDVHSRAAAAARALRDRLV